VPARTRLTKAMRLCSLPMRALGVLTEAKSQCIGSADYDRLLGQSRDGNFTGVLDNRGRPTRSRSCLESVAR
jgi:hypothetical protein